MDWINCSTNIFKKSQLLRKMVFELQENDKWDLESFKREPMWRVVMELSDEIKRMLENK
jgi:hypothetical protein